MSARIDAASFSLGEGRFVLAGGVDNHPKIGNLLTSAEVYDSLSDIWSPLPSLPGNRHGTAGTVLGQYLYVAGGGVPRTDTTIDRIHISAVDAAIEGSPNRSSVKWERVQPKPRYSRVFAAVATVAGMVVVAGGEATHNAAQGDTRTTESVTVEGFVPGLTEKEGSWHQLPQMPGPRSAMGFCTWRGKLIVAGGRGGDRDSHASVWSFDGRAWETLPSMKYERMGPALTVFEDTLWVVGGVDHVLNDFVPAVERFDEKGGTWIECHESCDLATPLHASYIQGMPRLR